MSRLRMSLVDTMRINPQLDYLCISSSALLLLLAALATDRGAGTKR